jgi:hypothetical protein
MFILLFHPSVCQVPFYTKMDLITMLYLDIFIYFQHHHCFSIVTYSPISVRIQVNQWIKSLPRAKIHPFPWNVKRVLPGLSRIYLVQSSSYSLIH